MRSPSLVAPHATVLRHGSQVNCTRDYAKRLTIPKKVFGQTVWFQRDLVFGPEVKRRGAG